MFYWWWVEVHLYFWEQISINPEVMTYKETMKARLDLLKSCPKSKVVSKDILAHYKSLVDSRSKHQHAADQLQKVVAVTNKTYNH